jgi:hypothetical protein
MFWQSVGSGLLAFSNWHIIVGAFAVLAASIVVPTIAGLTIGESDSGARMGAGCFIMVIGGPIAQACAVTLFVLFCLPAIMADGGFTPMAVVAVIWSRVLISGLLAMLFVFVLAVMPLIGPFIANTPGVPLFLQGIFVIKPLTKQIFIAATGKQLPDSAFPGIWACIGYVLIGIAVCYTAIFVSALIAPKRENSSFTFFVGIILGAISGLLPLLMYGRYIAAAIKA